MPRSTALLGGLLLLLVACGGPAATVGPTAAPTTTAATVSELPTTIAPTTVTTPPPAATSIPTMVPVTVSPPTEAPSPTAIPLPSFAALYGTPVIVGDQQAMSVLAFEQTTITGTKPRTGRVFVSVSIRIDAITITSFDSADFKLRDEAGNLYAWRTGRAPHLYDLQGLAAGHNYVGWITYEVPKSSIGKLVLVYRPGFLSGTKFEVSLS